MPVADLSDPTGGSTERTVARCRARRVPARRRDGAPHVVRDTFQAQVPDWVPLDADLVVVLSGIVELASALR